MGPRDRDAYRRQRPVERAAAELDHRLCGDTRKRMPRFRACNAIGGIRQGTRRIGHSEHAHSGTRSRNDTTPGLAARCVGGVAPSNRQRQVYLAGISAISKSDVPWCGDGCGAAFDKLLRRLDARGPEVRNRKGTTLTRQQVSDHGSAWSAPTCSMTADSEMSCCASEGGLGPRDRIDGHRGTS
jgi:hypothetical protein